MRNDITDYIIEYSKQYPHIAFKTMFDHTDDSLGDYDIIVDEKKDIYHEYENNGNIVKVLLDTYGETAEGEKEEIKVVNGVVNYSVNFDGNGTNEYIAPGTYNIKIIARVVYKDVSNKEITLTSEESKTTYPIYLEILFHPLPHEQNEWQYPSCDIAPWYNLQTPSLLYNQKALQTTFSYCQAINNRNYIQL